MKESAVEESSSSVLTAREESSAGLVIKTLVLTDLVGSTALFEKIGDARASELSARHDRRVRDLVVELGGREIDKTDGFLLLFERPVEGVRFALAYHRGLEELATSEGVRLRARAAVHLGEVALRENPADDVARGAKPLEVEGTAKALVARVAGLAQGGQTLLTRSAFELARRGTVGTELLDPELRWLSHGTYRFKGFDEPQEIFEVGIEGAAPLAAPPGSEKARRAVREGDEITLGWRAAQGQTVPRRPGWRLREKLAESGFGDVWLAAHDKTGEKRVFKFCYDAERLRSLRREVTLFRLLREGLGHRDDIGRVLDWNFDEAPYSLELDYSAGGNLAEWAAEQGGLERVPLATRIEIAAQVAEALAAAHSVGILHKDVKPANVLVTGGPDGRPRVVLTDFGIGAVTDNALLAASDITAPSMTATSLAPTTGGTHIYMAPELLEGKPASIQSDLYALGVMLYQMAIGDFSHVLAPGWDRAIDDEILREDVAAIVDGSPERRPTSGTEVAERLRRLDERRAEREAARREHREAERSRRVRRVLAIATGVATAVLVVVSIFALHAVEARRDAQRQRAQAEALIDFMLFDLRDGLESIGRLDLLAKVAEEAQEYFASLPLEDGELPAHRRAVALMNIGDVWMDQGETEAALAAYGEAERITAARAARSGDPESTLDLARARLKRAEALEARGEIDVVLELYGEARDALEPLAEDDDADTRLLVARARYALGRALWFRRGSPNAKAILEAAHELAEAVAIQAPPESRWRALTITIDARKLLGHIALSSGDVEGALESYEPALATATRLAEEEPTNLHWQSKEAEILNARGHAFVESRDFASAFRTFLDARDAYARLAEDDPTNLRWPEGLARSLVLAGDNLRQRPAEALDLQRQALAICRRLESTDPDEVIWRGLTSYVHGRLGDSLLRLGRPLEALEHFEDATELLAAQAEQDPDDLRLKASLGLSRIRSGQAHDALGRTKTAVELWESAVALLAPVIRADSPHFVLEAYASGLVLLDRFDQAAPILRTLADRGDMESTLNDILDKKGFRPP